MTFAKTLASAVALMAMAAAVQAQEANPAVVYDLGGKFDKSFNEAAYDGAERFKAETGVDYIDFEMQNDSQREQALRTLRRARPQSRSSAPASRMDAAMKKVAAEFPDTKFAIIDMVVDLPNVRSIVFKEEEGSYLVGMLAAMASKTGKVGFVGGMDIPLIRKFACGYVQGAKAANPDIEVFQNMTGDTGAAWNDPVKGGELAKAQIERGADVVYHAAGGTGIGVLQAAADAGKLGIGVDSNQNYLHPGTVLTSMLKRVDNAVYDAFKDVKRRRRSTRGHQGARPRRGRRRLGARRQQQGADHAEMKATVDDGEGQDHRRARSRCTTTCRTTPARSNFERSGA